MIRYTRSVTTSMAHLIQATTAPTPLLSKPRLLVARMDEWLSTVRNQLSVIQPTWVKGYQLSTIRPTWVKRRDTTNLRKGLLEGSPVINNTQAVQWSPMWLMTGVVNDLCGWEPVWSMTGVVNNLCGQWPVGLSSNSIHYQPQWWTANRVV